MTELTPTASGRDGGSASANAETIARVRNALDRLSAATQAVKMANETAQEMQQTVREAHLSPANVLRNWRAVNMLLQASLDRLDAEMMAVESVVRWALSPR